MSNASSKLASTGKPRSIAGIGPATQKYNGAKNKGNRSYNNLLTVLLVGCVLVHGVSLVYLPCAGLTWNIPVATTISILIDFLSVDFLLINAFECILSVI